MTSVPAPTRDIYRPRIHYTPAKNWMNDPNGLVFHRGVYHLFYQHNPYGPEWGNMSWGHATSTDLLTWTEQPVAIQCDDDEAIFSGSAVVDTHNTSGLGNGTTPPMVAVYTSAYTETSQRNGTQAQSLAYSLDEGQTWSKYAGNPVLDRKSANFRDPKVFWYDGPAGAYWVMVAVEATEHRVVVYKSPDLLSWEHLSDFTADGPAESVWECPDLFELPIDEDPTRTGWVLIVSVTPGGVAGGSGTRYFIGDFDGVSFTEAPVTEKTGDGAAGLRGSWLDWGRDNYAAVSFSGLADRRVMIGWMSNWQYAGSTPTGTWRSAMTLPREISLATVGGRTRLIQAPIAPTPTLVTHAADSAGTVLPAGQTSIATLPSGEALRVQVNTMQPAGGVFGLRFRTGDGELTSLIVDAATRELRLDRTASSVAVHDLFPSIERAPLDLIDGRVELEVYVDACSIEVFAQGGLATITDLIFPHGGQTEIEFFADAEVPVNQLELAVLS
ncbi:glycoside hydrolase family 32 protein [Arthrobacter sp. M4]|uniref:glycoside hydrolase family 32 protein n=1 Tax=Arthrobacter sp. M4 TaxID=218160 RepID=UPI001CDB78BF|nr:glycoside hydrolase family 32 protein [Arthrobacter sp. M4]MCA4135705.1 glycoside hydrolase family 32 protein [Arthrobacter sp. M4]